MPAALAQIDNPAEAHASDRDNLDEIIRRAENRARERGLSYRGQLTPNEAWALFPEHPAARLIDVRSSEELSLIGSVPGALAISWKLYPDWRRNPDFLGASRLIAVVANNWHGGIDVNRVSKNRFLFYSVDMSGACAAVGDAGQATAAERRTEVRSLAEHCA